MSTQPILPDKEFDLLGLDKWTLQSRLQTMLQRAIPQWRDFSLGFPENGLVQAQAILTSVGCSASREMARQMYFPTLTRRLPLLRLARPFGYIPGTAEAAQVDGVFSLSSGGVASALVTIPVNTLVQSGTSLYRTLAQTTISVGATSSGTVTVENSEQHTFQVTSPGDVANWFVGLAYTPYIGGSASVVAANGTYTPYKTGTQVWRSFLEMGPGDLGFIVFVDDDGAAKVVFGNGINGAIPTGTVQITYTAGGGSAGAVSAGATWQLLSGIMDANGTGVLLTFANAAASTGGLDQVTVEEARLRAPLQLRVMERAVTEPDSEASSEMVSGIAHAACITSEQVSSVPEDEAWIYLVGYGSPYADSGYYPPATPTTAQITAVYDRFSESAETPMVMNVQRTVQAAGFLDVDIAVQIYKATATAGATQAAQQATAKAAITTALQKYFAVADNNRAPLWNADWGFRLALRGINGVAEIAWSDIFEVIAGVTEVRKIPEGASALTLNGSPTSPPVAELLFVRLGTIVVYDMDAGGMSI